LKQNAETGEKEIKKEWGKRREGFEVLTAVVMKSYVISSGT
jgi:hypothetical protein